MIRPEISANFAITADGKISSANRRPSGWTSPEDHRRLLELRRGADALLVGRGTWQTDRMTLLGPDPSLAPLRCVVSRAGRFDPDHPMFRTPGGPIHLLVSTPAAGLEPVTDPALGAFLHRCALPDFLLLLGSRHGVRRIHCEGGGDLFRELVALDWIDTLHLTWAGHTIFGDHQAPTLTGLPGDHLPASRDFALESFEPHPEFGECFLRYRRTR